MSDERDLYHVKMEGGPGAGFEAESAEAAVGKYRAIYPGSHGEPVVERTTAAELAARTWEVHTIWIGPMADAIR